jgi:alkanesulfonate monooxygenase SsuD/methylene tetrahydromethanopterin reductase-like flavin-dependent oxidoreductase (luciferase family)
VAAVVAIDIGVGLPADVEGVTRAQLVRWARQAEDLGASTLACTDRVQYPSLESMLTLATVASVTARVRLMTSVLVAPLRTGNALFRKQVATLDRLSDHRLVLGIGVGRRQDDYAACGVDFSQRGRILDDQLDSGHPSVPGLLGERLLFGGNSRATVDRVVRHGGGWIAAAGLGAWDQAAALAAEVRAAWAEARKPGAPRLVAMIYAAGGSRAREDADRHIHRYYSFLGAERAAELARHVVTDPGHLVETRDRIAEAGFGELLLLPTSAAPEHLEALKAAVG